MGRGSSQNRAIFGSTSLRRMRGAEAEWYKGFQAFANNRWDAAEDAFWRAANQDSRMADAWLGLHALKPGSFAFLEKVFQNLDRLGQTQARAHANLYSSYAPAWFQTKPMKTPDDVRRAYARALGERGRYGQASAVLASCAPSEETSAAYLKLAFASADYRKCVEIYQNTPWSETMGYDSNILSAIAMSRLGIDKPAILALKKATKEAPTKTIEKAARYQLALAYEAAGQKKMARQELETIFAEDANFVDVADRLGIAGSQSGSQDTLIYPNSQPGEGKSASAVDNFRTRVNNMKEAFNNQRSEQPTEKLRTEDEKLKDWFKRQETTEWTARSEVDEGPPLDEAPTTPLSEKYDLPWKEDQILPWSQEQKQAAKEVGFEGIDFDSLAE